MAKVKCLLLMLLPCVLFAQDTILSQKQLNILTLGDSNGTFPYSWPQQLRMALPNAQLINLSKSGRTIGFVNLGDSSLNSILVIDENLKKAAQFIKDDMFDFIIIELGTNDAKNVFADRQKEVPANLEHLIKKIKETNFPSIAKAKIVIISPPPYGIKAETQAKYAGGGERVRKMNKSFKKVAKRNDCFFVSGYETPGLDIDAMTTDGLHLDAAASRKLIGPVVAMIIK